MRLRISPPQRARPPGYFHIPYCEMQLFFCAPHPNSHETCIIIYCFSLWELGKKEAKKLFYCYFVWSARASASNTCHTPGYTFICIVITNPRPPTTSTISFSFSIPPSQKLSVFLLSSSFFFDLSENFNC